MISKETVYRSQRRTDTHDLQMTYEYKRDLDPQAEHRDTKHFPADSYQQPFHIILGETDTHYTIMTFSPNPGVFYLDPTQIEKGIFEERYRPLDKTDREAIPLLQDRKAEEWISFLGVKISTIETIIDAIVEAQDVAA
ncbi:hypothetical protein CL616_04995 [archaeon]|nr:hypothetical protein [archaeon]